MTTVLEHLKAVAYATNARRAAGHAMTFAAGEELLRHATELVHLADVVGDYLAGDLDKVDLLRAFHPLLREVEKAQEATRA